MGVDDLLEGALDARLVFVTLGDKFVSYSDHRGLDIENADEMKREGQ